MQGHDKFDKDIDQDSDVPQTFGGPSVFTDKQEQPTDVQQQAEGATLTAPSLSDQSEQSGEAQISGGDELIEILSGVEKQIERLRGLHLTHEKKLNSIAQRSRVLEDAEVSLDSESSSLKQREQQLEDRANELDEQRQQLADQQTEQGQRLDSLAEIEQAQLEIEREREDFNKEREAWQALRKENDDQSTSFQQREVELQQRQIHLDQLQQSYTIKLRELEQERQDFLSQKESFIPRKAELDRQCSDFESQQSDVQQQIDEATGIGSELEGQIRSLKNELAQRDRALDELSSKVQKQDSQLQERFNALREESQLLEEKLKEQELQILKDEQAGTTIEQQQEQIEQLKSQLANLSIKADPQLMHRKDERIEELVEALHQARGQVGGEQSIEESEARVQRLLAENEQLRIQLERSSIDVNNERQSWETLSDAISTSAPADESGAVGEEIQYLQTQVHQLHQEADEQNHQTEDDDLQIAPNIQSSIESDEGESVKTGKSNTFGSTHSLSHPNVQAADEEQVTVQPQIFMKRRAGTASIITALGWLTVASVIIAGMSWIAANHYFPATVSASITFQASSKSNAALTNEQKLLWQNWHTNMLTSADFTSKLSKRLADRRLDQYANASTLRLHLAEKLAVDLAQPGTLTLTLAGTNKNELAALLDTLATTFISESNESLQGDNEGLKTLAVGTKRQGNQVLYASLNPTPILDERLKYASYMFAAGFVGAVILVSAISRRPIRPTDIFSDNDPVFVTPQR